MLHSKYLGCRSKHSASGSHSDLKPAAPGCAGGGRGQRPEQQRRAGRPRAHSHAHTLHTHSASEAFGFRPKSCRTACYEAAPAEGLAGTGYCFGAQEAHAPLPPPKLHAQLPQGENHPPSSPSQESLCHSSLACRTYSLHLSHVFQEDAALASQDRGGCGRQTGPPAGPGEPAPAAPAHPGTDPQSSSQTYRQEGWLARAFPKPSALYTATSKGSQRLIFFGVRALKGPEANGLLRDSWVFTADTLPPLV